MSTGVATGLLDRRRSLAHARHRRRRTMLLGGLAASAAVAGSWWVATGPMLAVHEVNISGYRQPDQARVVETIRIAARTGTMLKLPTVAVREALAPYPWVADVEVHHNWPRGLDVVIVPAHPSIVAITAAGERLAISETGRVLGSAPKAVAALPSYRVADLTIGSRLSGPAERAPFTFLTAMGPAAAAKVHDLRYAEGVLIGRLASGAQLRLGPPTLLWEKGRALEALLADKRLVAALPDAEYLDLSAPGLPALKPAEDPASEASTEGSTPSSGSALEPSKTQ